MNDAAIIAAKHIRQKPASDIQKRVQEWRERKDAK